MARYAVRRQDEIRIRTGYDGAMGSADGSNDDLGEYDTIAGAVQAILDDYLADDDLDDLQASGVNLYDVGPRGRMVFGASGAMPDPRPNYSPRGYAHYDITDQYPSSTNGARQDALNAEALLETAMGD